MKVLVISGVGYLDSILCRKLLKKNYQVRLIDSFWYGKQSINDLLSNPNFEIIAPVPLTLICFRHKNGDQFNERLLNKMNESGKMYMTHTKLNNQYVIRFSIGAITSSIEHLKETWDYIVDFASKIKE